MNAKNHSRSPEKHGFSIALPKTMIADLQRIADKETRSRNKQIEHFLAESVKAYNASKIPVQPKQETLPVAPRLMEDMTQPRQQKSM